MNRGEFDIVVVRDETRLGGDITRTGLLIQDLFETGCQLYYYFTNERVTLDGAVDKFMVAARNLAAELEREKISQRTREHLMVKARKGLNAGGKCFGYDHLRIENRVEYRINQQQAELVRDVFRRYRDGQGLSTIARALNEEGIAPPRAGRRGTGSWSPAQIRSMLHNERYAGRIIWGRIAKAYRGGTKVRIRKAYCDVLHFEMPELRIIDEELWAATRERMEKNCKRYGTTAPKSKQPRHLLSGIARCAECGGPIRVESSKLGNRTVKVYACSYNRTRGKVVCGQRTAAADR